MNSLILDLAAVIDAHDTAFRAASLTLAILIMAGVLTDLARSREEARRREEVRRRANLAYAMQLNTHRHSINRLGACIQPACEPCQRGNAR